MRLLCVQRSGSDFTLVWESTSVFKFKFDLKRLLLDFLC